MSLPVLIPVNRLDRAKGRLAALLEPGERETLALITFETVLRAAGPGAIVLTADPTIAKAAGGRARVLAEAPGAAGLNGQLEAALRRLAAEPSRLSSVLILHADLPLASEGAIAAFREASTPDSVVLCESYDGGTNAMLLRPPGGFPLHYGPDSFALHIAAAREAGMAVHSLPNRELRLDLDTRDDVARLVAAQRGRQGAAGRYLLSIGIEERLATM